MMEHEGDHLPIPMPITSKYVGDHHHQPHPLGHLHHSLSSPHDVHPLHACNGPTPPPSSTPAAAKDIYNSTGCGNNNNNNNNNNSINSNSKGSSGSGSLLRYRECLKNHAASIGGTALDGCGEFMPGGEDGTMEALKCSACGCHRNFHRKEHEGASTGGDNLLPVPFDYYAAAAHPHHYFKPVQSAGSGRKVVGQKGVLYHDYPYGHQPPPLPLLPLPSPHGHPHHSHHHHHHMAPMPLGAMQATSESDEMDGGGGLPGGPAAPALMKKRFRTKFTVEQKERMLEFAERVGWRLQRTEEAVVQQFCQEIGVKRRVLKVWMHNNKHNLSRRAAALGGVLDVGATVLPAGVGMDVDAHDHHGDNSSNSNNDVNTPSVQIHLHPIDHHQQHQHPPPQQQRHGC